LLFLFGTFAPALVALWLTSRANGGAGIPVLLHRILDWRVGVRWYVFAIGFMAAIKLTVASVYRVITGGWPRFGHEPWFIIVAAIVISTVFQAGEEIGWRGYAFPRLATRFGFARASLLLGVIWACWHLPLFFVPGADKQGQSFIVYLLQVIALSVAMAWLYLHTNGSLLLMMLMHSAVNQTKDIVPSALPGAANPFALSASLVAWLTVALLWMCAAFFLRAMRARESLRLTEHCGDVRSLAAGAGQGTKTLCMPQDG
jgi:membrane protease YdiL (CAAX protease family)